LTLSFELYIAAAIQQQKDMDAAAGIQPLVGSFDEIRLDGATLADGNDF
jgi:hypothetical protein